MKQEGWVCRGGIKVRLGAGQTRQNSKHEQGRMAQTPAGTLGGINQAIRDGYIQGEVRNLIIKGLLVPKNEC